MARQKKKKMVSQKEKTFRGIKRISNRYWAGLSACGPAETWWTPNFTCRARRTQPEPDADWQSARWIRDPQTADGRYLCSTYQQGKAMAKVEMMLLFSFCCSPARLFFGCCYCCCVTCFSWIWKFMSAMLWSFIATQRSFDPYHFQLFQKQKCGTYSVSLCLASIFNAAFLGHLTN